MRIGNLNRRITIQAPARADNGKGGHTKSWADAGDAWAEMIPLRGGEALSQAVLESRQVWKVTIHYRADVTTECRILFEGRPLNIQTAEDPDGRRRWLVMTAESGGRT